MRVDVVRGIKYCGCPAETMLAAGRVISRKPKAMTGNNFFMLYPLSS